MKKPTFIIGLFFSILFVVQAAAASVDSENLVTIETERTVGKGSLFSATIEVRSAIDLAAFQMDISFDPNVLEAVQVEQGSFLSDTGKTYWFDPKIDNARGMVSGFLCGKTDNRGAYGNGALATIVFKAIGTGKSDIMIQNVKLSNSRGRLIESASLNSSVTVTEFPPYVGSPRNLSISSALVTPGGSATVQLSVDDATGIARGDILVRYDVRIIAIRQVRGTSLLSGMSLTTDKNVSGELRIGIAGRQGIPSGGGALAEIDLTASAGTASGTETVLRFGSAEIYDANGRTIPIGRLDNGFVTIFGIRGDVNNDGKIRANDAILAMRIAVGLMIPTDQQKWAADMNGDGVVKSNDAILILRKATEMTAPGAIALVSADRAIAITLGEVYKVSGQAIKIPVVADDISMLTGGDIRIAYDPAMLRAVDVSSHSSVLLVSNMAEPGIVRLAFASDRRLSSHTIAEVQFQILAEGVSSPELQRVELYGSDALPLIPGRSEKEFRAIVPERSALLQNFPNPFNPETWLPYKLSEAADVTIQIRNVQGQLIRTLDLGHQSAGFYLGKDQAAYWDGRNEAGEITASGVYFYTIQADGYTATKKMLLRK